MKMPGFTAEASIYASTACYRSIAAGLQGDGTTIIPAQFNCTNFEKCSTCFPVGPSIFSPGRQFCQFFTCRPTPFGGCRCQIFHKGFRSCDPIGDLVATTE